MLRMIVEKHLKTWRMDTARWSTWCEGSQRGQERLAVDKAFGECDEIELPGINQGGRRAIAINRPARPREQRSQCRVEDIAMRCGHVSGWLDYAHDEWPLMSLKRPSQMRT